MTSESLRRIAFGLGLAGGILILVGGLAIPAMGMMMNGGMLGGGMMNPQQGNATSYGMLCCAGFGGNPAWAWGMAALGVVTGGVVIAASAMVPSRPHTTTLGVALIAASAASFLAMGGFMVGALLGIAAGVLAIVAHPRATVTAATP